MKITQKKNLMVTRPRFDRMRLNVGNFNRNYTTVVTDGHVNDNCCVYFCRNGPKISLHTVNYKIAYNGRVTIIVLYVQTNNYITKRFVRA